MRRHATVSASRPRVLPWGWGGRAGSAVLISVLAHAAAAVTAGAVFGTRVRGAAPEHDTVEISVDAPVPGAALAPGTEPVPAPPVKAARLVRRPTPMARPALAAAPAPAAASPATSESTVAVPAAAVPPARFAMSAATLAAVPARVGAGVAAGPTGSATAVVSGGDVLAEATVSVPARLLSGAPPAYSAEARGAGVEADLPLEIVVAADGRVTSARALTSAGYGLEAAALQAVRAYRFSPAERDGRRVAVRMRWIVQFRLR